MTEDLNFKLHSFKLISVSTSLPKHGFCMEQHIRMTQYTFNKVTLATQMRRVLEHKGRGGENSEKATIITWG